MKKALFLLLTMMMVFACSKERAPFNYRGLPMSLSMTQFVDSMLARGFAVDSGASDSGRFVVMASSDVSYRVLIAYAEEKVKVVQEQYTASRNDSTRQLWQQIHDHLEKELGAWPDCPMLKEDHKIANFDATEGIISVILENTYKPTLTVRYKVK